MNLETEIGERTKLSLEEYEELHENKRAPNQINQFYLEKKNSF